MVGKILAGWRYDISGIVPEMRDGYEDHFAACAYCRGRQRLHRTIDVSPHRAGYAFAFVFLLAYVLFGTSNLVTH